MQINFSRYNVGDLVEFELEPRGNEIYPIIGIVLRVDEWAPEILDLYVLWSTGETYWITGNSVKKINLI